MLPTRALRKLIGIVIQLIQFKGLEKRIFNYHKNFYIMLEPAFYIIFFPYLSQFLEHPSYFGNQPVLGIGLLILFPTNSSVYSILTQLSGSPFWTDKL